MQDLLFYFCESLDFFGQVFGKLWAAYSMDDFEARFGYDRTTTSAWLICGKQVWENMVTLLFHEAYEKD